MKGSVEEKIVRYGCGCAWKFLADSTFPLKCRDHSAEAELVERVPFMGGAPNLQEVTPEEEEAWEEAERRMDAIGVNGPTGCHYSRGIKYGTDKPMMDLIPPLMEMEVARVLTAGAHKYGPDNWRHVPDLRRRYIAAAKRHINALSQGIARDEETGLHHAGHAVCSLMFLGEVDLESGSK